MKTIAILGYNLWGTKFMRSMDVFDSSKVLIEPVLFCKFKSFGEAQVEQIRNSFAPRSAKAPYGLVAIFDGEKVYYRDSDIKVVSQSGRFTTVENFIVTVRVEYAL